MKSTSVKLLTSAMVMLFAVPAFAAPKQEDQAQNSSEQWLELIDAGKSVGSWETAADYFKTTVSQGQWLCSLNAVRRTLGDLVSRKLKSIKLVRSFRGAPVGAYMVLQFETSFTNREVAFETVTPQLDKNGKWRVCGYYIHVCVSD